MGCISLDFSCLAAPTHFNIVLRRPFGILSLEHIFSCDKSIL